MSQHEDPNVRSAPARRRGLVVLGVAILVAGLGAAIGVYAASRSAYADAVADLARVPVGCDTALSVEESGTFVVYVETAGRIGELRGTCESADTDYERDDMPEVAVTLLDDRDREVQLDDDEDASYDVDGYVGRAIGSVRLEEGTGYTILVRSDDDDFAVALGHDPKGDADTAALASVAIAAAGVLIGGALIVVGMRRRRAVTWGDGGSTSWPDPATADPDAAPTPAPWPAERWPDPEPGSPAGWAPPQSPASPPPPLPPPPSRGALPSDDR